MNQLLFFMAVVLLCNLAPAFAPPTWSIIVLFTFNTELSSWVLVATGALMAASGRYGLALYTSKFRNLISEKTQKNLLAAGRYFEKKQKVTVLALAILSPVPSAQLFEAAGLMNLPLKKLTLAFFSGRIITYSIYAASAHRFKESSLAETFLNNLTSPWGIAIQLISLAALVLLARIDWSKYERTPA